MLDAILNRQAVREYADKKLTNDQVEELVAAFENAPYGVNALIGETPAAGAKK
jgi:nitroreductase